MSTRAGALVLAIALAAAGCDAGDGGDGDPPDGGAGDTVAPTTSPATEPDGDGTTTSAAPTTTTTAEPVARPSSEPRRSDAYPDGDGALLTDVRVEALPGLDRVVFELDGDAPGWSARFADPPVTERPSGEPVEVEGGAFLDVSMSRASTVDLSGEEPEVAFEAERVDAPGAPTVTELVKIEDFEGVLAWVIGLDRQRPFAVAVLDDPTRVVVDIPHG